jgi:hypothetical protein
MASFKPKIPVPELCRQDRNTIGTTISLFYGFSYPMELLGMLYDLTGSKASKLVSFDAEIPITQLDEIETHFRRISLCFEVQQSDRNNRIIVRHK